MFPVPELAELAHEQGALFHCDAVQVVGKIPMALSQTRIDMLSCSAHKLHGPKGVGCLWLRRGTRFRPLTARRPPGAWPAGRYGKYQRHCRNGAAASELAQVHLPGMAQISQLRDRLEQHLQATIPAVTVMGGSQPWVPGTLNLAFEAQIRGRALCC